MSSISFLLQRLALMPSEHPRCIFDMAVISVLYRGHSNYISPRGAGCTARHLPASLRR